MSAHDVYMAAYSKINELQRLYGKDTIITIPKPFSPIEEWFERMEQIDKKLDEELANEFNKRRGEHLGVRWKITGSLYYTTTIYVSNEHLEEKFDDLVFICKTYNDDFEYFVYNNCSSTFQQVYENLMAIIQKIHDYIISFYLLDGEKYMECKEKFKKMTTNS